MIDMCYGVLLSNITCDQSKLPENIKSHVMYVHVAGNSAVMPCVHGHGSQGAAGEPGHHAQARRLLRPHEDQ